MRRCGHWGTFSLALHAWDEPAETSHALGPRQRAQLLMPRLGEALEPAHEHELLPWWRGVDALPGTEAPTDPVPMTLPKSMPWPVD